MPVNEFLAEQLGAEHPLVRPSASEPRANDPYGDKLAWLEILKRTAGTNAEEADAILLRPDPKLSALHLLTLEWRFWLYGLNYRPSDLIRVYGSRVLGHPYIIAAIQRLSRFARDPRDIRNPDPLLRVGKQTLADVGETLPGDEAAIRARGLAAIERMPLEAGPFREGPEADQASVLRDETSPANHRARSRWAADELRRTFRALADRSAYAKPKSHRPLRTFLAFERLRAEGMPEKQAVARIARKQGLTDTQVLGDIQRARERTGRRRLAFKERRRRTAPEKS